MSFYNFPLKFRTPDIFLFPLTLLFLSEAEYAFNMRKDIIPLIMQKGYKPDGWLGMILGAKMFYDFSGKYPFETRISLLTKAVQKISTGSQELDTVDGPTEDSSGFQTEVGGMVGDRDD